MKTINNLTRSNETEPNILNVKCRLKHQQLFKKRCQKLKKHHQKLGLKALNIQHKNK